MNDDGLKSGRGGVRAGAGRPKGAKNKAGLKTEGKRDKNIGIRVSAEELAMVKAKAEATGLGITDLVLEAIKAFEK